MLRSFWAQAFLEKPGLALGEVKHRCSQRGICWRHLGAASPEMHTPQCSCWGSGWREMRWPILTEGSPCTEAEDRPTSLPYHGQRKDTQLLGFKDRETPAEGHDLRKP